MYEVASEDQFYFYKFLMYVALKYMDVPLLKINSGLFLVHWSILFGALNFGCMICDIFLRPSM